MNAPMNDIDREFGHHECSVCGTDCSFVSDQIDEKNKRITNLEAEVAALKAERDALSELVSTLRTIPAIQDLFVLTAKEHEKRACVAEPESEKCPFCVEGMVHSQRDDPYPCYCAAGRARAAQEEPHAKQREPEKKD
jgi:hypothetical protein